ncbi:MAG: AbrB/MazE/SpoVT family DNA-binding domain-containing protein [Actinomycetota bacterium]|nr:AbrB/MazE/SpoVT family DNA-binding domain-containing protein [Actinomycetota bacterium]
MLEVTHVDARGRVVLPAALRAQLDLKEGTALLIEVEPDGSLHLTTREAKARALLGILSNEAGLMDELFAMRREERVREEAFLQRHAPGGGDARR